MLSFEKTSAAQRKHPRWLWGLVAVLAAFAIVLVIAMSQLKPAPADPLRDLRLANCNGDVACAGSRVQAAAEMACAPLIEALARYEVRWTGEKLPLGRWSERGDIIDRYGKERVIQYEGEGALFQNGFGAWRKVKYECDYDVLDRKALTARILQ